MSHLIYVAEIAEKKIKAKQTKKRHWNSSLFKKKNMSGNYRLDLESPDHDIMYNIACDWWNSWENPVFLKSMIDGFVECKGDKKKQDKFLDNMYHYFARQVDNWLNLITPTLFIVQFEYCIPNFFLSWYKEYELSKKTILRGDLQAQVLELLNNCKSIKIESIFKHFEMTHFEAEIKGILTRMTAKKYIECINFSDRLFYKINSKIEFYNEKWYI